MTVIAIHMGLLRDIPWRNKGLPALATSLLHRGCVYNFSEFSISTKGAFDRVESVRAAHEIGSEWLAAIPGNGYALTSREGAALIALLAISAGLPEQRVADPTLRIFVSLRSSRVHHTEV